MKEHIERLLTSEFEDVETVHRYIKKRSHDDRYDKSIRRDLINGDLVFEFKNKKR